MKRLLSMLLVLTLLSGCSSLRDSAGRIKLRYLAYGGSRNNVLYIEERGEPVPYLCFDSDYDGVLLVRKDYMDQDVMFNDIGSGGSYYPDSNLDMWLEQFVLESFPQSVENLVENVEIDVVDEDLDSVESIRRKVFVLSFSELGLHDDRSLDLGGSIEGIRDFDLVGDEWLRDSYLDDSGLAWRYSMESYGPREVHEGLKVRPCLVLPGDLDVDYLEGSDGYVLSLGEAEI
ncbi:MAG: hypothetical protein HDQ88_04455 [Clostridia bacterium]|nr:hypothetical protein [Clostridia bacterium]